MSDNTPNEGMPKRGRPAANFSKQQLKDAKKVWRDTKTYKSWEEAKAALPPGFTQHRAYSLWRGRK